MLLSAEGVNWISGPLHRATNALHIRYQLYLGEFVAISTASIRWILTKFPILSWTLNEGQETLKSEVSDKAVLKTVICLAEDRKVCEVALKLLLLALKTNTADVPIVFFYPPADKQFCDWLAALNHENVSLRTRPIPDAYGWNNKPHALLTLLGEGASEVIWIDTDILVTKRIELAFARLKPEDLVVAEEALLTKMIGALCALGCGVSV